MTIYILEKKIIPKIKSNTKCIQFYLTKLIVDDMIATNSKQL